MQVFTELPDVMNMSYGAVSKANKTVCADVHATTIVPVAAVIVIPAAGELVKELINVPPGLSLISNLAV